jgi:alginate O-acetyltransferase complex protein AlgI
MLFNSIEFAIFFPIIFILYFLFFNKNIRYRNLFIICISYFFYAMWDWRFLSLIIISSIADYLIGFKIYESKDEKTRKGFLLLSVIINIGILGFFKYFNFFTDSLLSLFELFGWTYSYKRLNIILPVGISFYTFQTLSYTLDIYRKRLTPTKDITSFFAFVSFFPQLVAGPIERAKDLLPQFHKINTISYNSIRWGLILIAIGLFKKIVIADRLAIYVDSCYANVDQANGMPMLIAIVFFAFQLYLDFSAYSDIAIGIARTLGFNLSTNFKRPYLSISFSDFWKRWHITLSSWFKDYVYISLGGNKVNKTKIFRNIFIVFLLSGLWHGASWNFVIWGALNGLFLILFDAHIMHRIKSKLLKNIFIFTSWALSLVFFRAQTFHEAIYVFSNINLSNKSNIYSMGLNHLELHFTFWLLLSYMIIEYINEKKGSLINIITNRNMTIRLTFYLLLILSVIFLGAYGVGFNDTNFIYFQF